jgi:hypothetical protein
VRRLFALVVFLAVVAGALSIGDVIVKDRVQSAMASRIESQLPGSHATVRITSFPFVGRLAVDGQVPTVTAEATNVRSGDVTFSTVRLTVHDVHVDRNGLTKGQLEPLTVASGNVVADVSQASVDALTHLPVVLGPGRVSAAGIDVPVQTSVSGDQVTVTASGLPSFTIDVPVLDILPCVDTVQIVTGSVQLGCQFHALPSLLAGAAFHF